MADAAPGRRRYPELSDREWLHRRYVVEGVGPVRLARELGCTPPAVVHALARNGIAVRGDGGPRPRLADVPDEAIVRAYLTLGSAERCAAHFGVTRPIIMRRLDLAGVDVAGRAGAHVARSWVARKEALRQAWPNGLRDAGRLRGQLTAGASVTGIARDLGVPRWLVNQALSEAGVSPTEIRRERNATIVRLAAEGVRGVEIAAMLSVDQATVSRVLSKARQAAGVRA